MRPELVALGILAAVLAGVVALELSPGTGDSQPMIPSVAPGRPPSPAALPPEAPGRQGTASVLARPLFTPGRRPVATVPDAAPSSAPAGLPRLAGITVSPAGRSVIFAAPSGGKPVVATEGTHIGAFVVQSIDIGQVILAGPDGLRTLHPTFDPTPAPVATLPSLPGLPGFVLPSTPALLPGRAVPR